MTFHDRLESEIEIKDSHVCVGLDPVESRLPDDVGFLEFNRKIIDATSEVAVAYKPNAAFYESKEGWEALIETMEYASDEALVVLDAKRGDIGNSSRRYADLLEHCDSITANPYMGRDSLQPFFQNEDKGVWVLCKTSNSGSSDFQDLIVEPGSVGTEGAELQGKEDGSNDGGNDEFSRLYEVVAEKVEDWSNGNAGLVVGATHPEEMESLRERSGELPFLVPGVGAQGGSVEAAVKYGFNSDGVGLVNSTRSIIYAGERSGRYYRGAEKAAKDLKREIHRYV
ncbi:MAG: orotidine-5'-phosphate decarboxylase [Halobacteria archaeon]